jgi:hypothetical protein
VDSQASQAPHRATPARGVRAADVDALVDRFLGFNFRLAPAIRRLGVPVIYYISPQIWASRPGRLATMRAMADRVLVIFRSGRRSREGPVPWSSWGTR